MLLKLLDLIGAEAKAALALAQAEQEERKSALLAEVAICSENG